MLGGENGRSPNIDFLDAERHPCVKRLTQASSLLRRGSRFDSPIAARGERRERAVRPATEPMRSSEGSIQVDESSHRGYNFHRNMTKNLQRGTENEIKIKIEI